MRPRQGPGSRASLAHALSRASPCDGACPAADGGTAGHSAGSPVSEANHLSQIGLSRGLDGVDCTSGGSSRVLSAGSRGRLPCEL